MALGWIFPGQGSQVIGMGKDFVENFSESKLVFEEASDSISVDLKKLCFDGPINELTLTKNLQPCLLTVEASIVAAIKANTDKRPKICAGHSLGEYSAIYASESLSISDAVKLTRFRGEAMQEAVPVGRGTMAAVLGLDAEKVTDLCSQVSGEFSKDSGEIVEPANFNANGQVVIAGTVLAVQKATEVLKSDPQYKGGKSIALQVSAPFHCSLMKPAQEKMKEPLYNANFSDPKYIVIANSTSEPVKDRAAFANTLFDQIVQPVRWEQSMKKLSSFEVGECLEIGPGKVLAGLMKRIDPSIKVSNISSLETFKEVIK